MSTETQERTVEDALAHAEDRRDDLASRIEFLSTEPYDVVLLADEVLRLRVELERLQGLLKG